MENNELLEKARAAKSAEELMALAKENGMEMTEEEAAAYFVQLNKSGELSDEELDNVAGGGCHKKDGRLVITMMHGCDEWACFRCGSKELYNALTSGMRCHVCGSAQMLSSPGTCKSCKYKTYEKGLWLCNNPANIK